MFKKGDEVLVSARVLQVHECAPRPYHVVILGDTDWPERRVWIDREHVFQVARPIDATGEAISPAPVTVRCSLGVEHKWDELSWSARVNWFVNQCPGVGVPFGPIHALAFIKALQTLGMTVEQFVGSQE